MSRLLRFAVVTAVAAFVTASLLLARSPSPQLQIVDLGDGGWSEAIGINDRGQIVGGSSTSSGPYPSHAVLWTR
jgi:probable HAF family extracellular repeat protein